MEIERTVRMLGENGEEERKIQRKENWPKHPSQMQRNNSKENVWFPCLIINIFTRGLAFIKKEEKENRSCLPGDPTPLEFDDLIMYEVAE